MPPINQAALASAGVIAVSVAVAAAIAVYESPELRRMADDLRRRIAVALHSLGDGVNPSSDRNPVFNRPEDAEGFQQSRGAADNGVGVDADDETRRKQREELLYWNAVLEEKTREKGAAPDPSGAPLLAAKQGSTFDDFLQQDSSAERGTYVFNTGADVRNGDASHLRHRDVEGVRGLKPSVYANPFADENGVDDFDDLPAASAHTLTPGKDEVMSDDIYNATESTLSQDHQSAQSGAELLFDFNDNPPPPVQNRPPEPAPLPERELAQDEFMTAGQQDREDAYASIQAWARSSNPSFYSPLPVSPPTPLSEPELVSNGEFTPTDSTSLAGSGEDVGNDATSSHGGENGRYYDIISEDGDGMPTPVSWTEVGSVVSESDGPARA